MTSLIASQMPGLNRINIRLDPKVPKQNLRKIYEHVLKHHSPVMVERFLDGSWCRSWYCRMKKVDEFGSTHQKVKLIEVYSPRNDVTSGISQIWKFITQQGRKPDDSVQTFRLPTGYEISIKELSKIVLRSINLPKGSRF